MNASSANLDLLRSTAVLFVLATHVLRVCGLSQDPALQRWGIPNLGHFGVLMFFIHTSLVLMMSLGRLAKGSANVSRFYIRRAFRIYPLSIAAVLFVTAFHVPAYFELQYTWHGAKALGANLLLVQNALDLPSLLGPLWSLPFEVQMYLVLPLLYFLLARIRSNQAAAASVIALGFAAWFVERRLAHMVGYPALLEYAPWFCMGVAAYALSRAARPRLSGSLYVLLLAMFCASPLLAERVIGDYRAGWAEWLAGIVFACSLPVFEDFNPTWLRKAAHVVATYSYGIYLSHVPILWFAFEKSAARPLPIQILIFAVLITAVPAILYHAIEAPLIGVGARLSQRMGPTPQVAEAHA